MHRRLFGISVLAVVFDALLPDKDKELVVDYASKVPGLYRTIVIVPPGVLHGLGVDNLIGGNDAEQWVWDTKRAWVLPDGRLEVERFVLQLTTNPKWRGFHFRTVAEDGELKTFTHTVDRWVVRSLDQMGNTIGERCSPH